MNLLFSAFCGLQRSHLRRGDDEPYILPDAENLDQEKSEAVCVGVGSKLVPMTTEGMAVYARFKEENPEKGM